MTEQCQVPPDGWTCSREAGHDGPCAAEPSGILWEPVSLTLALIGSILVWELWAPSGYSEFETLVTGALVMLVAQMRPISIFVPLHERYLWLMQLTTGYLMVTMAACLAKLLLF